MKKVSQLLLIFFLVLISIFFYFYYFKSTEQINKSNDKVKNEILSENQNNLIKNLEYQVKFDNNSQYLISADLSELIYEDNVEIVKMQKVKAKFINEENLPLKITSDKANYNNSNYNTEFSQNIVIQYEDNLIKSENLDLNFTENIVIIYNNVVYEGLNGLAKTDNIKIDLITKKINIFMNEEKKKIELISK